MFGLREVTNSDELRFKDVRATLFFRDGVPEIDCALRLRRGNPDSLSTPSIVPAASASMSELNDHSEYTDSTSDLSSEVPSSVYGTPEVPVDPATASRKASNDSLARSPTDRPSAEFVVLSRLHANRAVETLWNISGIHFGITLPNNPCSRPGSSRFQYVKEYGICDRTIGWKVFEEDRV